MRKAMAYGMAAVMVLMAFAIILPAAAADGSSITGAVTLVAVGDSTAEWTDQEAKFGDYSAKLTMPAGTGWVNDNAEACIAISDAPTLSDVASWSFWAKGQDAYYVPIEFYIDTDADGECDKIIVGMKMGSMTSEWVKLNQAKMDMYMAWKDGYEWLWNWGKVQTKYGNATVLRVDIGYGSLGSNEAVTAYVDDFALNNITYVFEPLLPIEVEIDIKPGSYPNSINLKSKGKVPVAVLTTDDFDASTIDPETILFADAEPVRWTMEDVDDDDDMDLLLHFKTQDLNLTEESTEATLTGTTYGEQPIQGTDTVNIVPKGK
ncbi:MAG: hypothetical protein ISS52_02525 [Dehalococcoidia bacterium]|nr:hypothetical protein [Dehalococcoidia bacterium]